MTGDQAPSWVGVRARLLPGDLLVAREADAVVVARAQTPAQEAVLDHLLALCRGPAPGGDSGRTVETLVRQAVSLATTAEPDDVPAFALVTAASPGLLVLVSGELRVSISLHDGSALEVDGTDSVLPVTRRVREVPVRVGIGPVAEVGEPDRRSDLSRGIVRAGGVVLAWEQASSVEAPSTVPDLEPVTTPAEPAPDNQGEEVVEPPAFTTFSLHDEPDGSDTAAEPVEDVVGQDTITEDSALPAALGGDESPAAPMVRGIICARGHFNAPKARFCASCGVSMVQQTHNVVTGVRPPLGVLVADDGSRYTLVHDYVIGRDPESSEVVRSGRALPLVLDDPDLSLSRVHALVVLDGWEVRLEDAGSANGTFLALENSEDWRPIPAGVTTTITPGAQVRLGSRVLTFESHHKV